MRVAAVVGLPDWLATAAINVAGSFLMGWAFVHLEARFRAEDGSRLTATPHFPRLQAKGWALGEDPTLEAVDLFRANQNLRFLSGLLMTGVLGSFTTFSAFSLQTLRLLRSGEAGLATVNVVASVILSLLAVALGLHLGQERVPRR